PGRLRVAIRHGGRLRVDLDELGASHAWELEVLQHVEELGLEGQGQIPEIVQVVRAPVRTLELSGFAPVRASESALLVPEELGLERTLRDRGAVDVDERTATARRGGVRGAAH